MRNANQVKVADLQLCISEQAPIPFAKDKTLRQTEKTPIMELYNRPSKFLGKLGYDAVDLTRRNLLAQPHIRTLLVIDGLFSVCTSPFNLSNTILR